MIRRAKVTAVRGYVSELANGCVPGQTEPLIITLTPEGSSERIDAVLKPTKIGQGVPGEVRAVRELFCAAILRKFGLLAPEPFLVTGLLLPIRLIKDPRILSDLSVAPLHFASEWIKAGCEYQARDEIDHPPLFSSAQDVFVADNLILNADRTTGKPNLWYYADRLVPIDHVLAFTNLRGTPTSLALSIGEQRQHFAFPTLHGEKLHDLSRSLAQWFSRVTRETILEISAAVPSELGSVQNELDRISRHCLQHELKVDVVAQAVTLCFKFDPPSP